MLGAATLAGLVATVAIGLFVVPPDATEGDVQRLMYVHVPAAWVTFFAFGIVFLASCAYLKTGHIRWDRIAAASAEIGVQFCALTILLGSLWGRPVGGTWWTWDPRLTTTAVLLLIYVGYLSLRRVADSPARRARWSAVVGVVGFIDVPIVHMSAAGGGRCTSRPPCCAWARRPSRAACWPRCSSGSSRSRWPTAT